MPLFVHRTTSEENHTNNITTSPDRNSGYLKSTSLVLLDPYTYRGEDYYMYFYTGIVIAVIISTLTRAFVFFWYSLQIGINLHDKMFRSVVRAPVKFFDDNPSGNLSYAMFTLPHELKN